jgi:uncharacterized membrane protein
VRIKRIHVLLISIAIIGGLSAYSRASGIVSLPFGLAPYSDIQKFYDIAVQPGIPYVDKMIEYPVLTGLLIHVAALAGQSYAGYYLVTSIILISSAVVATWFLYKTSPGNNLLELFIYWVLAPSMFVFLIYNWDMLAVLFVVIALYFVKRDRVCCASLFLALGFCSKLFPLLFLLPLLMTRRRPAEWLKIAGVFAGTALIINGPFMLLNWEGWYHFVSFNSQRNPNPDSIWGILSAAAPQLTAAQINAISLVTFAAGYLFVLWRFRQESTVRLCFFALLVFLLCNKVFSPQYTLWLLPFFVLLPMSRKWLLFYAVEISNVPAFVTITYYYSHLGSDTLLNASRAFVVARHIVLACLLFHALRWRSPAALGVEALKIPSAGRKSAPEQLGQVPHQAQEGRLRSPDIQGG